MSKAARSLFVFGIYLILLGIFLIVLPDVLLSLFQVSTTQEVWIRVAGMLVMFIGIYDLVAARGEFAPFIQWSVYVRTSAILFFIAFVVLGLVEWPLILFGVIDLLGAAWTQLEIRRQKVVSLVAA